MHWPQVKKRNNTEKGAIKGERISLKNLESDLLDRIAVVQRSHPELINQQLMCLKIMGYFGPLDEVQTLKQLIEKYWKLRLIKIIGG